MSLPSSILSSLDVAFNDGHQRLSGRSFPENLGSVPLTPKVLIIHFKSFKLCILPCSVTMLIHLYAHEKGV